MATTNITAVPQKRAEITDKLEFELLLGEVFHVNYFIQATLELMITSGLNVSDRHYQGFRDDLLGLVGDAAGKQLTLLGELSSVANAHLSHTRPWGVMDAPNADESFTDFAKRHGSMEGGK